MRASISLAWLLLRGGGRRDLGSQLLAGAAFAVSTGLLLITFGFNLGFAHRADRAAWTIPAAAHPGARPDVIQSTVRDYYDGRPITVVTIGRPAGASGPAPVPPGLTRFPGPGQTWFSPALAGLVRSDPGALKDRWPGTFTGTIGARGLQSPDQLVVVVGAGPDSPRLRAPVILDQVHPDSALGPIAVTGFADRAGPGTDRTYQQLSRIASILLIVPLLVLAGAAARLGLARRDHRLATLRLVGGSSAQILTMVAIEAAATAGLGALAGTALYTALIPVLTRVAFGGGTWFAADLWVGPVTLLAVLLGVVLGGVGSAISTLRRVVVSPLGITQRHAPTGRHRWRVLVFFAALGAYLRLSHGRNPSLTAMVIGFGIVFLTLNLLGPWVMAMLGRIMVAGARGPARLLAGRRILDDPKAAWRVVGGMALTGFIAGFLALFPTSAGQIVWGSADVINVAVPAGHLTQDRSRAERSLRAAGLGQPVHAGSDGGSDGGALMATRLGTGPAGSRSTAYLSVPVTAQNRELTRTALHRALPGLPVATGADVDGQDAQVDADLHRASTAVLIASFLVAIASAGITACAGVLDRRRTFQLLHLAGLPLRLLDEARDRETTAPLLILVGGSLITGLVCAAPITRLGLGAGGGIDLGGLSLLALTVITGLAGVRLASAASRPLLRAVATDTTSRPD